MPRNVSINAVVTLVFVIINNNLAGVITLEDQIKRESFDAINKLKKQGIKYFMPTGDNKKIAESVSGKLNLDGFLQKYCQTKNRKNKRDSK